jgi:hypothetical protein
MFQMGYVVVSTFVTVGLSLNLSHTIFIMMTATVMQAIHTAAHSNLWNIRTLRTVQSLDA